MNEIIEHTIKVSFNSMRLEQWQKNMLQNFANLLPAKLTDTDIKWVAFGKQDSRGALSITIIDSRHCVPMQKHFSSKDELLGYVDGWMTANNPDVKWL